MKVVGKVIRVAEVVLEMEGDVSEQGDWDELHDKLVSKYRESHGGRHPDWDDGLRILYDKSRAP